MRATCVYCRLYARETQVLTEGILLLPDAVGSSPRAVPPAGVRRRSLWLQEALAAEYAPETPRLEQNVEADVCIVGGGYTGLWTAQHILDQAPGIRIALVEADICGGAASGRNGGFVDTWWAKVGALVTRVGASEALRLGHASEEAVSAIGAFCQRHEIDAHFTQRGWLWTATATAHLDSWKTAIDACVSLGVAPFVELSADEVARRTGSAAHLAGVFEPAAATVQPACLARGLRRVAIERGVTMYERSPMLHLDRGLGIVSTPRGSVKAPTILLATNAWLARVPELGRALMAVSSDVVATEPLGELLALSGWTGGESVSNSRMMVHYYRTTRDNRIVFGRGGGSLAFGGHITRDFNFSARRSRAVSRDMRRLLPVTRDADVTHAWAGAVDRSADGLPIIGRLPGNAAVWYAGGYSGNGVGPSYVVARILAACALSRNDQWARSSLVGSAYPHLPPEPYRYLGGQVVQRAVARKEALEEAGESVGFFTRKIALLVPAGYARVRVDGK